MLPNSVSVTSRLRSPGWSNATLVGLAALAEDHVVDKAHRHGEQPPDDDAADDDALGGQRSASLSLGICTPGRCVARISPS
jgi:hypothetical protein